MVKLNNIKANNIEIENKTDKRIQYHSRSIQNLILTTSFKQRFIYEKGSD